MPLSIPEAIEVRKSIRNFKDTHILDADINEIFNWMANRANQIGPFGTAFTIEISIQSMLAKKERLGTYGYIKNAQGYILGLSQPDPRSLFEYGYVFENLVLFLTSIGIGTCWLAGTFDRKQLINNTRDTQGKIIPAITPIGYPAKNKHLKERITRLES